MTDSTKPNFINVDSTKTNVESPCISVCYMNEDDVCAGCYRNAVEITQWMSYSNDEKRAVIVESNQRRKASGFSF